VTLVSLIAEGAGPGSAPSICLLCRLSAGSLDNCLMAAHQTAAQERKMNLTIIVAIAVLVFVAVPIIFWARRQSRQHTEMLKRACRFALVRYDQLVSPKLKVITEFRLRVALKTASADEAVMLNFMIKHTPSIAIPTRSFLEPPAYRRWCKRSQLSSTALLVRISSASRPVSATGNKGRSCSD
jgi:hypothetical protein